MAKAGTRAGPVLLVMGPTASGKSALALAVARAFSGTVINADSMQVYDVLRVLTARPDARDLDAVPHRLYGVRDPALTGSVAEWRAAAMAEIDAAHAAGRLPVMTGGTGLYFRALTDGLVEMPDIPAPVRTGARAKLAELGAPGLHAELARRDPVMAARLAPGDSQRVLRAWEVLAATGRSLADWQDAPDSGPPPGWRFASILLAPDRARLYADIDARFAAMFETGALAEVARLRARRVPRDTPAMKALGVPDLLAYLEGATGRAAAIAAGAQATRRYAKRQTTWFRHQIVADLVIEEKYSSKWQDKIFSFIRQNVLTGPG
jgi:tRNA dimethylallyltransferase